MRFGAAQSKYLGTAAPAWTDDRETVEEERGRETVEEERASLLLGIELSSKTSSSEGQTESTAEIMAIYTVSVANPSFAMTSSVGCGDHSCDQICSGCAQLGTGCSDDGSHASLQLMPESQT